MIWGVARIAGVDHRVAVLGLARMTEAAGEAFLVIVLPIYIASGTLGGTLLGLPEALFTGIVLSASGLLGSFFHPVPGWISDRLGRRKPFILGGLGARIVTFLGYLLAPTYLAVLALRAIQGLGGALSTPTTLALIDEYSESDTRGGGMGVYSALRLAGTGAGPIAAGIILQGGPYDVGLLGRTASLSAYEAAIVVAIAAIAASFVLVTLFVRDAEDTRAHDRGEIAFEVRGRDRLLDPVFVLSVAAFFFGITLTMIATIQPAINARLGQSEAWFGLQYSAFLITMVFLALPFGLLSDRTGRRPWLLGAWLFLAPATLAQGFVTTPVQMLVARVGQGIASAMAFAPAVAMVGDHAIHTETGTGSRLSMFTMFLGIGLATGPLVSGALVQFGYPAPFVFATGLTVVGFLLVYTQTRETHEDFRGGEAAPLRDRFRDVRGSAADRSPEEAAETHETTDGDADD